MCTVFWVHFLAHPVYSFVQISTTFLAVFARKLRLRVKCENTYSECLSCMKKEKRCELTQNVAWAEDRMQNS